MFLSNRKLLICLIILLSLVLTGCTDILPFFKDEEPERVSNLSAGSVLTDSAEVRTQTIQLINNARKAIFIELAALDDSEILNLLVKKSKSGVEVRILLDQWQTENSATVKNLKNQNISVQYYPAQKGQYHRVRCMVVDYQVALFYSKDWTKASLKAHSMAIKLTGNTAWSLAKSYNKDWQDTTTLSLDLPENIELPEDYITYSVNAGVKQQILRAINTATSEIKILSEQLSDPETVNALIEAKKRGCKIEIILSPSCATGTPNTIKRFKETAIDVRYFNNPDKQSISYNVGIFDNKTLIITNSSWTYYTFFINHEGVLVIPSPAAVEKINNLFNQEWKTGTPS